MSFDSDQSVGPQRAAVAAQTQNSLQTTCRTRFRPAFRSPTAADNAAYWSIATQLTSDSGVVTAANSALSQSQAVLDHRNIGDQLGHHHDQLDPDALTQATNPSATSRNINTTLAASASSSRTPSPAPRSTASTSSTARRHGARTSSPASTRRPPAARSRRSHSPPRRSDRPAPAAPARHPRSDGTGRRLASDTTTSPRSARPHRRSAPPTPPTC